MWHRHIRRVQVGDLITDTLFNDIIAKIEPFSKISAATDGYLTYSTGPYGTELFLGLPRDQMARLSGSSNPYAWQSVYWDGGAWVDGPALSYNGTDAYEYNGATGLDGQVVRMSWTSAGDWRFQALRYGTTPCESGRICVTVQQSGCGTVLTGATVTVTDDATPPNVIGTGAASGSPAKFCVDILLAGTYHVTSHVPGATDQTSAINAVCGVDNNITLTYPTNSIGTVCFTFLRCTSTGTIAVPDATVTTSGTGVGTGTGDGAGGLCMNLGVGSYSADVGYPSGGAHTVNFDVDPCSTTNVTVTSITSVCFEATTNAPGCTANITVTDEDTGTVLGTGSITTTFDGVLYYGTTCVTITEIFIGDFNTFGYDVEWPVNPYHATAAAGCYSTSIPLNADGLGGGCS